ncbi:L-histidine N(alpha)-methyltransferase [Rhodococcus sp. SGAir0479]|uniref:L-histidine N(alpha)-methyltransferase n=1 Tax=Rhodococcus sp. SGAir0479 TaxID=2567884 RepID=UPI0010CD3444|nr:L-histidine N(alpha)-methyltransferase [Rhodococcus sp. SGAir0479]QCQ90136.1 L-histidine N(alpha)-methyltransferase [Rhodococcus sp. SGAir0479]
MSAPTLEIHIAPEQLTAALREDVATGLTSSPKRLPPKWFYDARGSELFERITQLPEYYPTRTERSLLEEHAREIAVIAEPQVLVELGSGSSEKTRLLLEELGARGTLERYVPQDVSESALRDATNRIAREFPEIEVHGVVGDFTESLHHLPSGGRRMIAFLGGTLGNLVPDERREFLASIADVLDPGEHLLLGVALVTDPAVLVPAYDDAEGVTAQFNLNVLSVLNKQLGADFDLDRFRHVALWDPINEWIEMRLEATTEMSVRIADLGMVVPFGKGEQLRTEISAKFRQSGIRAELAAAGFDGVQTWSDPDERFALVCACRS